MKAGHRRRATAYAILACSALAGCTSGPTTLKQPAVAIPPAWSEAAEDAIGARENWWLGFRDPHLDALVDRVLRTNDDLRRPPCACAARSCWRA